MRAWNLIVKDFCLIQDIAMGVRKYLCFRMQSSTAKRVHVGDTVVIHNYTGDHRKVVKVIIEKKKILADVPGEEDKQVCIYLGWK